MAAREQTMKTERNGNALMARLDFYAEMLRADVFTASALAVAFVLLYRHMNGTTCRCDPARATLAEETGRSEGSIKRAIRELKQSGWWHVGGGGKGAGRGHTNSYQPNSEKTIGFGPYSDHQNGPLVTPFHSGKWAKSDLEIGSPAAPEPVKNQENSYMVCGDSLFEKFWTGYPSRAPHPNPKQPARTKFKAALKRGVDPDAIIRGAENYAFYVDEHVADRQRVAQAKTWRDGQTTAPEAQLSVPSVTRVTCERCGSPFAPRRADARFCSPKCRVASHRKGAPSSAQTIEIDPTLVDPRLVLAEIAGNPAQPASARVAAAKALLAAQQKAPAEDRDELTNIRAVEVLAASRRLN
jgi:hypothetical protein